MSDNSKIEWLARPGTVPASWNPITGCTKISEGCKHCYAERMANRLAGRFGYPADDPFRVTWHPDRLAEPLRWRKPRTVFVCSMGDLFHEDVNDWDQIFPVLSVCKNSPQHTFVILTKRPERMLEVMNSWYLFNHECYPWPNIWLGVTAENQQRADERIPPLLQCPAAVRFVSIEPMVGAVNLTKWLMDVQPGGWTPFGDDYIDADVQPLDDLHWIICGGESGPGARPMNPDWARDVRDQCAAAGVPFFFKQMPKRAEIPADLAIREWPAV